MDPGGVDLPVTLVIKAPNQKYEDQTINCFLNWTVERLKSHISNVYPSKPLFKDQRLVYSGRLLQDHLQLRDVLRKQDEYHMMHLVCTSHTPPSSPQPHSHHMDRSANTNSSDSSSSSSPVPSPNQDGAPASDSTDGLRYRGGLPQYNAFGVLQWPGGAEAPLQGALPGNVPPHPMYMPMQMLWWQQMYARQYYMQYQAAVAASQSPGPPPLSPPSPSPPQPDQDVQPPLGPNPLPEDQPANPNIQVNPNIQMNAQGGAVLNEDELNRDWLDWLYTVSRAGVLLSIVYFYSSFSRFIMVLGGMLLVYMHQAGWFPFRVGQENLRGERGGAAQEEADRQNDMQEMERLMDEGLEDDDSEDAAPDRGPPPAAAPGPGFLATTWGFISTFFTSLIPEGRPHQAN